MLVELSSHIVIGVMLISMSDMRHRVEFSLLVRYTVMLRMKCLDYPNLIERSQLSAFVFLPVSSTLEIHHWHYVDNFTSSPRNKIFKSKRNIV